MKAEPIELKVHADMSEVRREIRRTRRAMFWPSGVVVALTATGLALVTVLAYDVATVTGAGFLFLGVCLWAKS